MYDTVYTAQGNGRRDGRFYIPEALSTPLFVFPVRVEQCGVGLGLFVVTKATLLFSTPPPLSLALRASQGERRVHSSDCVGKRKCSLSLCETATSDN